eukprot:Seg2114.2 transcript_id=Seg2114.2/GoldUCD/mRNA.D3Y31 product="Mismatch repair endonuclease PMS2" protein_id=Seg2114.2/GoldUCD/D3Y31
MAEADIQDATIGKDASNETMQPSIKAIDRRSVHQICSGQVILTLATAVKELVENSIDAGATNIEIKTKEYGVESLEVSDNGSGIEEKDFEAVGLKHCTSKLREFSDLTIVDTFGFRGEAISSLCALSKLIITTRHHSKAFGCKLEFDYNGKLTSKAPCAREQGTTVAVSQLFHTLPVRHKEFKRNIKKEFAKLSTVLQAYGIISTGIRISCINFVEKRKNVILSTNGCNSMFENVANVFGPKQVQNLLEFSQETPTDQILEQFSISQKAAKENDGIFNINGYISRVVSGCGRSSPDRQFYFINRRPCDIAKIARMVNEVYHMFNRHQYPFVFLDVSMNSELVDVNITPDKRQIFIQNEKLLLATLKTSLLNMFQDTAGSYDLNTKSPGTLSDKRTNINETESPTASEVAGSPVCNSSLNSSQSQSSGMESKEGELSEKLEPNRRAPTLISTREKGPMVSSILSNFRSRFSNNRKPQSKDTPQQKTQSSIEKFTVKVTKDPDALESGLSLDIEENKGSKTSFVEHMEQNCGSFRPNRSSSSEDDHSMEVKNGYGADIMENSVVKQRLDVEDSSFRIDSEIQHYSAGESNTVIALNCCDQNLEIKGGEDDIATDDKDGMIAGRHEMTDYQGSCRVIRINSDKLQSTEISAVDESRGKSDESSSNEAKSNFLDLVRWNDEDRPETRPTLDVDTEKPSKQQRLDAERNFSKRASVEIPFDMEELSKNFSLHKVDTEMTGSKDLLGFHAKIAPSQNNAAEEELRKNVSKDKFKAMEVLGQFNLGFIIAKLEEDLFIIDQHATDEKYNFERLQREHCLKGQRLIRPRPLELTPVNENILIDNVEIFRKNGFEFIIDKDAPSTKKVKLVSLPTSKNWTFDVQDIEELIFMLSDTPGVLCRPSRVRNMFASRSCRMSTMVGCALNHSQMKTLLNHMAEIEHPWNCPHGRPTMRHLVNLNRIGQTQPQQQASNEE